MPIAARNLTVPEPVEGTHPAHVASLRQAQRPYGRAQRPCAASRNRPPTTSSLLHLVHGTERRHRTRPHGPEPVEGTHPAHLTSLRQAQRPYGRATETTGRFEKPTTRIAVAAALSPRDGTQAPDATHGRLSLSKGRTQPHLASLRQAQRPYGRDTGNGSRFEEPAAHNLVAAALRPRH